MNDSIIACNNQRLGAINEAVFNLAYPHMLDNDEVERLYLLVLAQPRSTESIPSYWIPPHVEPCLQSSEQGVLLLRLAVSPAAVKSLVCQDQTISMDCRINGKPTLLHIPTTQILQLAGVKQASKDGHLQDEYVDVQHFAYCFLDDLQEAQPDPEPPKKRPTLVAVK